ncbi:MAG: hypothetical protein ABS52_13750 [Gemmatimonadetes bacterium SCN 70-22]|nr:MAG: hypothetical protein ABS52_13750 [Gemmatimonadetes bacterium SCN 70-22]
MVLALASRRVIGWAMRDTLDAAGARRLFGRQTLCGRRRRLRLELRCPDWSPQRAPAECQRHE